MDVVHAAKGVKNGFLLVCVVDHWANAVPLFPPCTIVIYLLLFPLFLALCADFDHREGGHRSELVSLAATCVVPERPKHKHSFDAAQNDELSRHWLLLGASSSPSFSRLFSETSHTHTKGKTNNPRGE
jgi:hypothetical protein